MSFKPSDINVKDVVIVGGVIAGGIALYKIAQGFGFIDSAKEQQKQQVLEDVVKPEAQKAGTPTLSNSNIQLIAQTIYEMLRYSSISDDKPAAVVQLKKAGNTADILNIIMAFGTRQNYWFGIPWGDKQTLPEFVNSNLSRDDIEDINEYYRGRGINYQF